VFAMIFLKIEKGMPPVLRFCESIFRKGGTNKYFYPACALLLRLSTQVNTKNAQEGGENR